MTDTKHHAADEAGDDPALPTPPEIRHQRRELAEVHRRAFRGTLARWIAAGWPAKPPVPGDYTEGEKHLCALAQVRFDGFVKTTEVANIVRRALAKFLVSEVIRTWPVPRPTVEEVLDEIDDEVFRGRNGSSSAVAGDPWTRAERDEELLNRIFGAGVDWHSVVETLQHARQTQNLLMYRAASMYMQLAQSRRSHVPAFSEMVTRLTSETALRDVTEAQVHVAVLRFCVCLGRSTR